ncbi:MAG: TlpA disulfide reductase family protein [Candidatus Acidiferrales bacterium]
MKKIINGLLFFLLLVIAATNFSGCNSRGFFKSLLHGNASTSANTGQSGSLAEPNVTFKDLDGKDVSLASLKGKVVVVNFWATWCEPCQVEIPEMIEFQQKYASRGFTLLGVAMDDEGKSVVAPFVQKTQFDVDGKKMTMNYPIVLGNDDLASKFGGIIGLPTTVVISRDGKVVKRFIGLAGSDALESQIQKLL